MSKSLQEFCQEYFKVMGCLSEPCLDSTYEIILPDELVPFFKQNTYLKISFTPELPVKNGLVEFITYGNPVLLTMIESAIHTGRTTRNFVTGLSLKKGDITPRIIQEYHLRPDQTKFSPPFPAMAGYLLLYYKLSYLADEKFDRLYPVAIDLFSGAINNELFNKEDYFFLEDKPDIDLPSVIQVSASGAHQNACRYLNMQTKQTVERLAERVRHKKYKEIERVNRFFEQGISELKSRVDKLESDAPRKVVLQQKIETLRINQQSKIIDLNKKYTYRLKGELISAHLLIQPKLYYQFEVALPYVAAQGYFGWDPVLKQIDPPVCQVCYQPLHRISVCANGHIVCANCSIYCHKCKKSWCSLCADKTCQHMPALPEAQFTNEIPQIEFSQSTFDVLDKIEKSKFEPFPKFRLSLKAQELSLIEGFDKLLCLETVRHIEHFDYQVEAARKTLKNFSGRALLCDEVGLGKTIEAGLVLKEYILRGLARKVLILVPPSLIDQWRGELLDKFNLDFSSTENEDFPRDSKLFWETKPYIIASLHTAKREPHSGIILKQRFDMVIVDEAHHLKNRQTLVWKFVDGLDKRFILLLTATPIQNNLEELFNLITLLKPGQLSTYLQFKKDFGVRGDKLAVRNSDKLRNRLSEVMIRNSRSEVSIKLPPRRAETQKIEPFPEEMVLYQDVTAFVRKYQPVVRTSERGFTYFTLQLIQMEAGSSPIALRQTIEKMLENPANYPDAIPRLKELLDMAGHVKKTAKAHALLNWLMHRRDPTLIFTNFLGTQRFVSDLLKENGFNVWDYHGGLSNPKKDEVIANFRDQGGVLVSTEVGSEGKNFQFCQHLINFDLPWNPMKIEQRIGRIHRIGQQKPVDILNFSARGTIESHILKILDEKINMFEMVIGEMDMILGNLDEEREFENIVMEIWTGASDEQDVEEKFERLGEEILDAKRKYLEQKKLDETLFGSEYSS